MPLVKIDLVEGQSETYRQKLISIVGDVLVASLGLPQDDRNIRVSEYKKSNIVFKPPYEFLIEIDLFSGRSKEIKAKLYKNLVEELESKLNIPKTKVFIFLNEQPLENWGVRGGVSAADIKFDFKIEK